MSNNARIKSMESVNNPTESNPYDEFVCFRKLPPELRVKIWEETCYSQPRVVEVEPLLHKGQRIRIQDAYLQSKTPVPAILHVSAEARAIGLRSYQILSGGLGSANPSDITYINFEVDAVFLRDEITGYLILLNESVHTRVSNVALGPEINFGCINMMGLKDLPQSSKMYILPRIASGREMTLLEPRLLNEIDKDKKLPRMKFGALRGDMIMYADVTWNTKWRLKTKAEKAADQEALRKLKVAEIREGRMKTLPKRKHQFHKTSNEVLLER